LTFQVNVFVPFKVEEQKDSKLATQDVELTSFSALGNDLKKNRYRRFYIKDIPKVGGLIQCQ
jgi:hypothetical protein